MELRLSKSVEQKVEETSKSLGLNETELVSQAVLFYLDNIKKFVELQQEFKAWDELSDEAWSNFEKMAWKREKSG